MNVMSLVYRPQCFEENRCLCLQGKYSGIFLHRKLRQQVSTKRPYLHTKPRGTMFHNVHPRTGREDPEREYSNIALLIL